MAKTKPSKEAEGEAPMNGSSLIICRNKHWRYISSFHGQWLHLPPEILESLAHQNWTMPSPRLIDPAVFFDIVKIRKAVDEASQDSVRAATGISNNAMNGRMDYFGAGGGPGSKLSKERIFKIRQKAVRLLSTAFSIDEVATSVATMQATSTIEDVGQHVWKREPNSRDAKYVHYFHEKIPSRAVDLYTPLEPLTEIINSTPWEEAASYYRTRATVQTFKYQWDGAAADLTTAMRILEELKRIHKPGQQQIELASKMNAERDVWKNGLKDSKAIPPLKEENQPTSIDMQLLFSRGNVYLNIATVSINAALDGLKEYLMAVEKGEVTPEQTAAQAKRVEARMTVKKYAKRALKDFMAFLSRLEYTPGLSAELAAQLVRRMNNIAQEVQEQNGSNDDTAVAKRQDLKQTKYAETMKILDAMKPTVHTVDMLFQERPPADLSPYPHNDGTIPSQQDELVDENFSLREAVTYHPLLTDVLHTVLMTHALLQTSPTELLRHAHNAARLVSLASGHPIFQPAISPSRGGWRVILRLADNWIGLKSTWSALCVRPVSEKHKDRIVNDGLKSNGSALAKKVEKNNRRLQKESAVDAMLEDFVVDESSLKDMARTAGHIADEHNTEHAARTEALETPVAIDAGEENKTSTTEPIAKMLNGNDKHYPFSLERAEVIARWIKESPVSLPGPKKRKPRAKKSAHTNGRSLPSQLSDLSIQTNDDDVD